MIQYFGTLNRNKTILWCYFIWYFVILFFYFDPSINIWINSLGISFVIGFALLLSVSESSNWRENKWQTVRLFLMPFCVSSFSSLIKGQDFMFIFPTNFFQLSVAVSTCLLFVTLTYILKKSS